MCVYFVMAVLSQCNEDFILVSYCLVGNILSTQQLPRGFSGNMLDGKKEFVVYADFFSLFVSFFFFLSKVHNLDTKLNFICALLSPFQLCKQGC